VCHIVLQCVAVCCNLFNRTSPAPSGSWISGRACCTVLQYVAMCCNVLQCVAMCCSVLQYVAVCCSVLQFVAVCRSVSQCVVAVCRSVLRYVAVLLIGHLPLQVEVGYQVERVAVRCNVLQCVAMCGSMLQCVAISLIGLLPLEVEVECQVECLAVCCSALQCVAVRCSLLYRTSPVRSRNWKPGRNPQKSARSSTANNR